MHKSFPACGRQAREWNDRGNLIQCPWVYSKIASPSFLWLACLALLVLSRRPVSPTCLDCRQARRARRAMTKIKLSCWPDGFRDWFSISKYDLLCWIFDCRIFLNPNVWCHIEWFFVRKIVSRCELEESLLSFSIQFRRFCLNHLPTAGRLELTIEAIH